MGLAGWFSLLLLVLFWVTTIARHYLAPTRRRDSALAFYAATHIQWLFFVLGVGVQGVLLACFCLSGSDTLIFRLNTLRATTSLIIETVTVTALVATVARLSRARPVLNGYTVLGLIALVCDLFLIVTWVPFIVTAPLP